MAKAPRANKSDDFHAGRREESLSSLP